MEPALPQDVELTCEVTSVNRLFELFVPGLFASCRAVKR